MTGAAPYAKIRCVRIALLVNPPPDYADSAFRAATEDPVAVGVAIGEGRVRVVAP